MSPSKMRALKILQNHEKRKKAASKSVLVLKPVAEAKTNVTKRPNPPSQAPAPKRSKADNSTRAAPKQTSTIKRKQEVEVPQRSRKRSFEQVVGDSENSVQKSSKKQKKESDELSKLELQAAELKAARKAEKKARKKAEKEKAEKLALEEKLKAKDQKLKEKEAEQNLLVAQHEKKMKELSKKLAEATQQADTTDKAGDSDVIIISDDEEEVDSARSSLPPTFDFSEDNSFSSFVVEQGQTISSDESHSGSSQKRVDSYDKDDWNVNPDHEIHQF